MRSILFLSIALNFQVLHTVAQTSDADFATANTMYENRNYEQAIQQYENILKNNGASSVLYYNLANAYYKNGQMGNAILNYERCLQMEPSNSDAKFNLSLANLRIKDQLQPVEDFFLKRWWFHTINRLTAKTWSFAAITCAWLALCGFTLFLFSKKSSLRKVGFYFQIFFLILFIFSSLATTSKISYDKNVHFAIITSPSAIVKSGPAESETNLTIIHEGLKLQILDTDTDWAEVKLSSGLIGWVFMNSFTEI